MKKIRAAAAAAAMVLKKMAAVAAAPEKMAADAAVLKKMAADRVRVHYEGTLDDGTRFDSSYERNEPLEFVCGSGQMIHGFDQAVAQMNVGEIVNVRLEPEEAYGMPDPAAVMVFRIRDLPGSGNLVPGQRVQLEADNGQIVPVRVTARDDETITLDANHEMAGKALNGILVTLSRHFMPHVGRVNKSCRHSHASMRGGGLLTL